MLTNPHAVTVKKYFVKMYKNQLNRKKSSNKKKQLDKSWIWKGGLGKNKCLGGLKTRKGGPGKNVYPDRLKTRKGDLCKS